MGGAGQLAPASFNVLGKVLTMQFSLCYALYQYNCLGGNIAQWGSKCHHGSNNIPVCIVSKIFRNLRKVQIEDIGLACVCGLLSGPDIESVEQLSSSS